MSATTNKNKKTPKNAKAAKAAPKAKRTVARTKKVVVPKATYRPIKIGIITYRSASAAVKHLLKNTKLPQVKIAEKCGVTAACVCQLASEYRA